MIILRIVRLAIIVGHLLLGVTVSYAAEPLTTVKVAHWGHEKILIYAPLYIAMDAGFFEQQGIKVELAYSGNDDQVFATVLSGAAQFGIGDPVFTAISREKGGQGKVVAALVGRVANWGVAKEANIQPFTDPNKLDGLTVTSFPSPSTTYTILSSLKETLNLSKMTIKQMAFGTEQAALARGEADLAIMLEPQASIAEAQGMRVVWSLAKHFGAFALTGVTVTDSYAEKNPATIQRFVNALQATLTFCAKNPEAAAAILEKSFPNLAPAVIRSATKRMIEDETIPRSVVIDNDAWIKTLKTRQSVGDLKSLDVAQTALDSSFAENSIHASQNPVAAIGNNNDSSSSNTPAATLSVWEIVGNTANVLGIISFVIFIGTIFFIVNKRAAWSKLDDYDKECGPAIRQCFPNKVAKISEMDLILSIRKRNGRNEQAAKDTLLRFRKAGILKIIRSNQNEVEYAPTLNILTDSVILFELWE